MLTYTVQPSDRVRLEFKGPRTLAACLKESASCREIRSINSMDRSTDSTEVDDEDEEEPEGDDRSGG